MGRVDGKSEKNQQESLIHSTQNNNVYSSFENSKGQNFLVDEKDVKKLSYETIKVYNKRWLILAVFCMLSASCGYQWVEYNTLTSAVIVYWSTNEVVVSITTLMSQALYIPLMFVATYALEMHGLRKVLIFSSVMNLAGSIAKIFSVDPHMFSFSLLGQFFAAVAQSFILEVPAYLASLWFDSSQVSTATSIGVFGNQFGVAIGYLIPMYIVPSYSKRVYSTILNKTTNQIIVHLNKTAKINEEPAVQSGIKLMFSTAAGFCLLVTLLTFFVISDEPSCPPSRAGSRRNSKKREIVVSKKICCNDGYFLSLKTLCLDFHFILLLISFGINNGTYNALSNLLTPLASPYFTYPGAGNMLNISEVVMVATGVFGVLLFGFVLDKTKAYKLTAILLLSLSTFVITIFGITMQLRRMWINFLTIGTLGFTMIGFLPVGYELAAEMTYPVSEAISSGLLNISAQVFSIIMTFTVEALMYGVSVFSALMFMAWILCLTTIILTFIHCDFKRLNANLELEIKVEKTSSGN